MTERLRDNLDDLEALVGVTAEAFDIPSAYVEKDFWVTEVLRAASVERTVALPDGSTAPTTFTFKGERASAESSGSSNDSQKTWTCSRCSLPQQPRTPAIKR